MEPKSQKKQRVRSPAYPMISLDEAIEKVNILWEKEKNNPFPKEAAMEDLGYDTYAGYSARVISAIKQFGLISEAQGNLVITEKGIDISLHSPDDIDYISIVKEIALYPNIYRKLYNEYSGDLPSDATLKIKLIKDHGFNAGKIDKFIKGFRRTLTFSGLIRVEEDCEGNDDEEVRDVQKEEMVNKNARQAQQRQMPAGSVGPNKDSLDDLEKSFVLRLKNENQVTITFHKFPIEESDLKRIKSYIDLQMDVWTEPPSTIAPTTSAPTTEEEC